jgi:hypothetical protein
MYLPVTISLISIADTTTRNTNVTPAITIAAIASPKNKQNQQISHFKTTRKMWPVRYLRTHSEAALIVSTEIFL